MEPFLALLAVLAWAFWWYLGPVLAGLIEKQIHRMFVTLVLLHLLLLGVCSVWAAFASLQRLGGGYGFVAGMIIATFALLPTLFLMRLHVRLFLGKKPWTWRTIVSRNIHVRA